MGLREEAHSITALIVADLRMPGTLEALDAIFHDVDADTLTAPEAIEQLLSSAGRP